MINAFCDNHPDREAIVTLYIKVLRPGTRPMILGFESSTQRNLVDLCEECSDLISPRLKEAIHASTG